MTEIEFREVGRSIAGYWNRGLHSKEKAYSGNQAETIWRDIQHYPAKAFELAIGELRKEQPDFLPTPAKLIERTEAIHHQIRTRVEVNVEKVDPEQTEAGKAAMKLLCRKMSGEFDEGGFNEAIARLKNRYPKAAFADCDFGGESC